MMTLAAGGLLAAPVLSGLVPGVLSALALAGAIGLGLCTLRSLGREAVASVEAGRLKTELMSNVSHELRTPLNAILGYAEVLESMPELPSAERDRMITRILSNAVTLTCSINNLLEYSSVAAGERAVRPSPVRLADLFDEIEPWVGRMIDGKPIAFAWAVEPELPAIETDRSKLRQVVLNLLSNAAKFTSTGEIHLSAVRADVRDEGAIEIAVTDTGVGMSASEQSAIFEDFRQVAGSSTRPFGGMGLGLTLVQRLCELLGGSIVVESAPARGTRVALRFPVTTSVPQNVVAEEVRLSA